MKPQTNTKCKHCGYQWKTKSILLMCTCPNCRRATEAKNLEATQAMSLFNAELILTALKNTKTVKGAKKATKQINAIYPQIEGSFYTPQIKAELDRLQKLIQEATQ